MFDIDNEAITDYIIKNNSNVRETASHFGVSTQTISNRVRKSQNRQANYILDMHRKYCSKFKYLEIEN